MAKQVIILNTTPGVGGITTVQYAFWLVPTGGNVVPNPGFVSAFSGASTAELSSLQAGTTIEQVLTAQYPSSFSLATIETDLQAKYTTAQSALTSAIDPILWYGTFYDGTSWTQQSLSLPPLPSSTLSSASWTSATALNTALQISLTRNTSTVLVPINITGTVTGGVVSFQASVDGVSWLTIQGSLSASFQPIASWSLSTGTTAILFNVSGYSYFRALLSTVIAGTGSASIVLQSTYTSATNLISAGIVGTYNSAAPTPANGSGVPVQTDAYGNLFIKPIRRSQTVSKSTTIATSTTATTVLAAQAAGIFADISQLVITVVSSATSTPFTCTLSDGTNSYIFDVNPSANVGNGNIIIQFNPPLPATSAATAWTITNSSATPTVHITVVAVLQKVS